MAPCSQRRENKRPCNLRRHLDRSLDRKGNKIYVTGYVYPSAFRHLRHFERRRAPTSRRGREAHGMPGPGPLIPGYDKTAVKASLLSAIVPSFPRSLLIPGRKPKKSLRFDRPRGQALHEVALGYHKQYDNGNDPDYRPGHQVVPVYRPQPDEVV